MCLLILLRIRDIQASATRTRGGKALDLITFCAGEFFVSSLPTRNDKKDDVEAGFVRE